MFTSEVRNLFTRAVEQPDEPGRIITLLEAINSAELGRVASARKLSEEAVLKIPVLLCHVAYIEPEAMVNVLDRISVAWLTSNEQLINEISVSSGSLTPTLEEFFWKQMRTPPDVNQLLQTFATYNSLLDPSLKEKYTTASRARPGVEEAFQEGYLRPATIGLDSLKQYAVDTLGHALYDYITSNNLQLEFTGGSRPGTVSQLADYVALRILQTHDIWHIILGYSASNADEVAQLAFQSAQVGTIFSSHVLALAVSQTTLLKPERLLPIITVIAQGWNYGRQTPPLLPIKWEEMFDSPLEKVRAAHQIKLR